MSSWFRHACRRCLGISACAGVSLASQSQSWVRLEEVSAKDTRKASVPKTFNELYFSLVARTRTIMLTGHIDDESVRQTVAQLMFLDGESPGKPIKLLINSGGGHVQSGLFLYDIMQNLDSPVHTVCGGRCSSMAAVILAGGAKGERAAMPHGRIMIHEPTRGSSSSANAKKLQIDATQIEFTRQGLIDLLCQQTGLPRAEVEGLMDHDHYMTPKEAIHLGIIDKVVEPASRIAAAEGVLNKLLEATTASEIEAAEQTRSGAEGSDLHGFSE